jgi:hypothetical protein
MTAEGTVGAPTCFPKKLIVQFFLAILANVRLAFRNLTYTKHLETDDFEASHAETDLFCLPSPLHFVANGL